MRVLIEENDYRTANENVSVEMVQLQSKTSIYICIRSFFKSYLPAVIKYSNQYSTCNIYVSYNYQCFSREQ